MNLYYVSDEYVEYLSQFDPRVMYNKEHTRPYVGILIYLEGFDYLAPLSSPKKKHLHMHNTLDFQKISGGQYGAVNFNNMIPVPASEYSKINLEELNDVRYKRLLENQIAFLNSKEKRYNQIAQKVRSLFLTPDTNLSDHDVKLKNRCCNFSLLESKCILFINDNVEQKKTRHRGR